LKARTRNKSTYFSPNLRNKFENFRFFWPEYSHELKEYMQELKDDLYSSCCVYKHVAKVQKKKDSLLVAGQIKTRN
jgi:hypothetical protein